MKSAGKRAAWERPSNWASGLALFVIAAWLFFHNWPGDYVDAQHQWAVPREYYYNMSDNRLVELGDLEYQEVTRNLLATQPEAASYIVRAYVYACGSCDTAPHQVVFLERFTPEAIKATIELEHLISRGVGNTDQTRSISKMIEHGHFIGRFIDPLQGPNPKPTSASPPAAATLPSPTTQSASARTGSALASTTSPTDATGERPVLLEKMNWLLYDANAALLSNPIPGCKDRVNRCSPEAK